MSQEVTYTETPGVSKPVLVVGTVLVMGTVFLCAMAVLTVAGKLQPEHVNAIVYGGVAMIGLGIGAAAFGPAMFAMARAFQQNYALQAQSQANLVADQSDANTRSLNAALVMFALQKGADPQAIASAVSTMDRAPELIEVGNGRTVDDRNFVVRNAALRIMAKLSRDPTWSPTQKNCMEVTGATSHATVTAALNYLNHTQQLVNGGKRGATRKRLESPTPTVIDN